MPLQNEFFTGDLGGKVSPTILSQPKITTAGGVYMARLGEFMFCLDTAAFQELTRQTEYRWSAVNRIGRKPAQQFTGQGEDTIQLTGTIFPHFRGGLSQMEQMRQIAGRGDPLPLIYAFSRVGQFNGLWCIKSIQESRTVFFKDGTPRKIEFTLSLTAYGEDTGASGDAVLSLPEAIQSATTIPTPPLVDGLMDTALNANDTVIDGITLWDDAQPTSILGRLATVMGDAAITAADMVGMAQERLSGLLTGMSSNVMALIPPDVHKAVQDVAAIASLVIENSEQAREQFDILKTNASQLRAAAKGYETDLAQGRRLFVQLGGIIKGQAINLSTLTESDAPFLDRVLAAASLQNAAIATDQLIYAANETARQVATAGGKIRE